MSDTNTACPVLGCTTEDIADLYDHLPDVHGAIGVRALASLARAHRDQILAEGAELIRQHRGDLNTAAPWWDTRDRDTAAQLLLNARTTAPHVSGQLCTDPTCGPCSFDRAIPPAEMAARRAARTTTPNS